MQVMVSIVITFCNQFQYVERLINSIIFQKTCYDYEILIAVDGDDDGTVDLLNKYKKRYNNIYVYTVKSNTKLLTLSRASLNRWFLLQKSKGKYFIIIDGDDFFISTKRLQRAVFFLENNHSYIGHACSRANYFSKSNQFEYIYTNINELVFNRWILKNYIHVSQCVFRNIFCNNEKYFNYYFFNDKSLLYFMLHKGIILYENIPMFAYRLEIDSIYQSQSKLLKKLIISISNIINFKINNEFIFKKKAAFNLLYVLLNYKYNIPQHIIDEIIYQKIPLIDNFAISIKNKNIRMKLFVYCWCIYNIFMPCCLLKIIHIGFTFIMSRFKTIK